ncbi:MAG: peptide-N-glycosidase F-related protein [Algibacter sp.]
MKYMINNIKLIGIVLIATFISASCDNDNKDLDNVDLPEYNLLVEGDGDLILNGMTFPYTNFNSVSPSQSFTVKGKDLSSEITISISDNFQLSINDTDFSQTITLSSDDSINETLIYVRFAPNATAKGDLTGNVNVSNPQVEDVSFNLKGKTANNTGIINYQTFDKERVAFGGGFSQASRKTFTLHNDLTNIESIKMYVKLTCPDGGCDEWDVFANVKIKDLISGEDYELGRFITPYWNDNSQLPRGFEFDVTDFKSMLTGEVELRIRTECWNAKGYEVSVDFDYIEGTPDYPYYAITRIFNYDSGSAGGVPYGIAHDKDLQKVITIPANAESTHLRTFINGWGEANPGDVGGRRCAEWCYRTHKIKIDGTNTFDHYMGPLGCADNPVNNQSPGNWTADRAGWCPGMVVPIRIDELSNPMAGGSFNFEYTFENWVSDESKEAYYPISTFVVVKSNTEIVRPTVVD